MQKLKFSLIINTVDKGLKSVFSYGSEGVKVRGLNVVLLSVVCR